MNPSTQLQAVTPGELRQWDRRIVWHPFTQMAEYEPLIIERAHGCMLVDIDGREYLDGVSSLWCNLHGHRHPKIDAAIIQQLGRVGHTTALGASNPTTIQLAKRLVGIAPAGLNHVYFSDSGSEAVEVALKMAFQYWRQCSRPQPHKTCYVALGDAYHGDTLGSVSVGGVERFHELFRPLLFDVLRLPTPSGDCQSHLDRVEELLAAEHHRIAAMVIEPLIQAAAGMRTHPSGYLRGVRALTRKYDVLLIADEVATGFGRTGTMFACQQEDVTPDFLCLAKGLTGGYLPLAATLATDEIFSAFLGDYSASRTFFHGHTYCGNPLGAAAALASLDVFEEERVLERLQPKIARLTEHVARIGKHPHVGEARQCGLMAGIELVRDRTTKEPYPWAEKRGLHVCLHTRDSGVLLRPLGNVIVIMPPLAISIDQLDRICLAVERGIDAVTP